MPASPRRKAFGQHFLKDPKIISSILEQTFKHYSETQSQTLLEIGPGKGALTLPLLDKRSHFGRFILVEKDKRIANDWVSQEKKYDLEVHTSDFLDLKPLDYLGSAPTFVVSNLPYSAGTAILLELLKQSSISTMVLMFQKEVAQRLYANPQNSAWGSLSLHVQNNWEVTKLLSVPPRAFNPPPDVDSEVVLLKPRLTPQISGSREYAEKWDALLRIAFTHRRKMIRSAVPPKYLDAYLRANLDSTLRSDALSWKQWEQWFNKLI